MRRRNDIKKIIVIGAGISGLTAAQRLKGKGYSVTVIESTMRVGGRLKTNRKLGFAFDEGASWIHTPMGNPITPIAKRAGLKLFLTDDNSIKAYDVTGKVISYEQFEVAEKSYEQMIETLQNYGKIGESFERVYRAYYPKRLGDLLQQFFLSSYLTFDTGGLDVLSSVYYNEGEIYKGQDKMVINGYDTLAQFMAQGLDIQFGERVNRIEYDKERVEVVTENNRYTADNVIVTVPLGVLKKGAITFIPPLPEQKQQAIEGVGMNKVDKYYFEWNQVFWDEIQYIAYTAKQKDIFNYYLNINKIERQTKGLMTFAYALQAEHLEKLTDEQVIKHLMSYLQVIYGSKIPKPQNMLRSKWGEDSNTYGSYSFTQTNTRMEYFDELARPIGRKLFFAGEHTNRNYYSTVHGAYLSGLRGAWEIIKGK